MKFILSGGGTGGHVNPALAIGAALQARYPDAEMHYVGTPKGIENKLVPANYTMHHIEIKGLKRSLSPENIKTAIQSNIAFHESRKLLRELRPDAVIGTGGYACWPICAAAAAMKIPCFLHESNAVPGFAVKMLERKADVIFVNFEKTAEQLKRAKKVLHVGTPLRAEFKTLTREKAREICGLTDEDRKVVLSFGGSLGASAINHQIHEMMRTYGKEHQKTVFLHAAGSAGWKRFKEKFDEDGLDAYQNLRVSEYIYDMPARMISADLVICRSGAMTLSELAYLRKPSILIPSPNVTNDQQTKNAALLANKGAAVLLRESDLTEGRLTNEIDRLLTDGRAIKEMSEKLEKFAVGDAEKRICDAMEEVMAARASK